MKNHCGYRKGACIGRPVKAAVVPAVSSSWQIQDVPQPQPGPNQVLVKMHASGIAIPTCTNPLDTFQDNFLESLATSQWARLLPWRPTVGLHAVRIEAGSDGPRLDPRLPLANTLGTVCYRTQPKSALKRNSLYPTQTRILGVAPEMRVFLIVSVLLAHWCSLLPCGRVWASFCTTYGG
jgi:hypothetical protein